MEREREGEKHQCVVASCAPPHTEDMASNPGMCSDLESNQWPFGSQASTQSTEPHQPGQKLSVFIMMGCAPLNQTQQKEGNAIKNAFLRPLPLSPFQDNRLCYWVFLGK